MERGEPLRRHKFDDLSGTRRKNEIGKRGASRSGDDGRFSEELGLSTEVKSSGRDDLESVLA